MLLAVKRACISMVTTVFPRQSHYATDEKELADLPIMIAAASSQV
jgi:hypothetical protein